MQGALLYAKWENPERAQEEFALLYREELEAGQLLPSLRFFRRQHKKFLLHGTIEDVV